MKLKLKTKKVTTHEVRMTLTKAQLVWIRNAAVNEHNHVVQGNGRNDPIWIARCKKIVEIIDESDVLEPYFGAELCSNVNAVDPQFDNEGLPAEKDEEKDYDYDVVG